MVEGTSHLRKIFRKNVLNCFLLIVCSAHCCKVVQADNRTNGRVTNLRNCFFRVVGQVAEVIHVTAATPTHLEHLWGVGWTEPAARFLWAGAGVGGTRIFHSLSFCPVGVFHGASGWLSWLSV